jgi:rSAM/selenodomain-associated transferase 2
MKRDDGVSVGIVLPVYNEAAILDRALDHLGRIAESCPVVVVDGGSTDDSLAIARRRFRTEVCPEPNRGLQMNTGARCLGADVLLFLHADSQLPRGLLTWIDTALADPSVAGGCFQLRFDYAHRMLRFYSWFTRHPGRFFHFGDQGFFVRREIFRRMGGYRQLPFLEDVDFLRRLRRHGRFAVLPAPIVTSARRFLRCGVVRQQLVNILVVALFELGVSPHRLVRLYPPIR